MTKRIRISLCAGLLALGMVLGACGNPLNPIIQTDPTIQQVSK